MDALVMCGGQGRRLDAAVEKPLYEIDGQPMIDRVLAALEESWIETVYAVGSPSVPETMAHVAVPKIEGPGKGYVADLNVALEAVERPVLTLGADLPLLRPTGLNWVLEAYETGSAMVAVPAERKRELGVSIDETSTYRGTTVVPTGVNVVGEQTPETTIMTEKIQFAVNVNRPRDARIATHLARHYGQ